LEVQRELERHLSIRATSIEYGHRRHDGFQIEKMKGIDRVPTFGPKGV
jgi:hypothetical protein